MERTVSEKQQLYKTAFALAVFTIVYNIAEGLLATYFGYEDDSLALFGFGVDSFIEVISGLGIAHMIVRIRQNPDSIRDQFERTALKITGFAFYGFVAGILLTACYNIWKAHQPETTLWGVAISVVSIIVMWAMIIAKTRVGKALDSAAILADTECTRVCIYMSVILLVSSTVYELTNIPYIDSIGSIGLAFFAYREGRECFEKASSDKLCGCSHSGGGNSCQS